MSKRTITVEVDDTQLAEWFEATSDKELLSTSQRKRDDVFGVVHGAIVDAEREHRGEIRSKVTVDTPPGTPVVDKDTGLFYRLVGESRLNVGEAVVESETGALRIPIVDLPIVEERERAVEATVQNTGGEV